MTRRVQVRFYAELNDFQPPARRQREFIHEFSGERSVKDLIEALGVPHTEVDLILVDGDSVDFDHRIRGGERVSVYPVFERIDVTPATRLRPEPLRDPRFVCDVHLGKLARDLRTLGFDTLYEPALDDDDLARMSADEHRILLTRDRGLLMRNTVTHGYWLRSTDPRRQASEVVEALDLHRRIDPFARCRECNGTLEPAARDAVSDRVPPRILADHDRFTRCPGCGRVYWRGSHADRLQERIDAVSRGARVKDCTNESHGRP